MPISTSDLSVTARSLSTARVETKEEIGAETLKAFEVLAHVHRKAKICGPNLKNMFKEKSVILGLTPTAGPDATLLSAIHFSPWTTVLPGSLKFEVGRI